MRRALACLSGLLLLGGCAGDGCSEQAPAHPTAPAGPVLTPERVQADFLVTAGRLVDRIKSLETESDVTCWTSFRQLDGFIATRMYSEHGQLLKIAAMKKLLRAVWHEASLRASGEAITAADLDAVLRLDAPGLGTQERTRLERQ